MEPLSKTLVKVRDSIGLFAVMPYIAFFFFGLGRNFSHDVLSSKRDLLFAGIGFESMWLGLNHQSQQFFIIMYLFDISCCAHLTIDNAGVVWTYLATSS
jgi:hypothetical protein